MKMSAILLLSLLFITTQVGGSAVGPRGLIDDAEYLIYELRTTVQTDTDAVLAILQTQLDTADILADTLLTSGEAEIEIKFAALLARLDEIEESAGGADITDCLTNRVDALNNLAPVASQELTACVVVGGDRIKNIVGRANISLTETVEQVNDLERELYQCGTLDDICIAAVIGKIPPLYTELPAKIQRIHETAQQFLTTAEINLENCGISEISKVTLEGYKILDEIQACVQQVIGK